MKSILYGIGTLHIGGTEKHLIDVIRNLSKNKDYKISIFLLFQNGRLIKEIPKNVTLYKIPNFVAKFNRIAVIYQSIKLIFLLLSKKIDILHFYLPHMYLVGGLINLFFKKKMLMSRRSLNYYQNTRRLFKFLEPKLHKKCSKILVNSKAIMNQLITQENVDPKKICLIYNGVKIQKFFKPKKKYLQVKLVCISNFIGYKRHLDLIEACKGLKNKNWNLTIIGRGDSFEVQELINKYNLNKKIKIKKNIDNVIPILKKCDVGLIVSEEEGFCTSIIEYMSCGLAVIASRVGGNPEAVVNRDTGFLYDCGNIKKLRLCIETLLNNTDLIQKFGENGKKMQISRFSLLKQTKMYISIYNSH